MLSVNEKSPLFMTMVFKDELNIPLIPSTVEWNLYDKTNSTELQAWTIIPSPAATMNLTIPGDKNTIEDEVNVAEQQIFSIRVDDGLAGEAHQELLYNVLNLQGPTGA